MPELQYDVALNYDTSKATSSLAAFRATAIRELTAIADKSAKIELLKDLDSDAKKSEESLRNLRTRAEELKRILGTLGESDAGFKKLTAEAKATNAEITALERALQKSVTQFDKLTASGQQLANGSQAAYARLAQLRSALDGLEKGDEAFVRISAAVRAAERDFAKSEAAILRNKTQLEQLATASQITRDKIESLKNSAAALADALKKSEQGTVGYKLLQDNLKAVEKELKSTEKAAASQTDSLKALEKELGLSAKNTAALTIEQNKLATALENAKRVSAVQAARGVLGVTGADEAKAQIDKLNQAYAVLHAAEKRGAITSAELGVAKRKLAQDITSVEQSVLGTNQASNGLVGAFGRLAGGAAGLAIAAGAVASGLNSAKDAAVAYEQGMARISSITTQSKAQLAEMGAEALKLTAKIGIDLPTALNALYNIISSGIPADNALQVLSLSAKAAIAGVTDIDTAATLGVAVLNAYGKQVGELERVFDVLFQTVKDGVVTFPDLKNSLSEVLPVARTAGISLEEVSSAMIILTRNGLSAAESSTALQRTIQALTAPTPEAIAKLTTLGIRYDGLVGTLRQIADKNLSADILRTIIPDVRGERGVAILSRNVEQLDGFLKTTTDSLGAMKTAFDKLSDTPAQKVAQLSASFTALRVATGEKLIPVFTAVVDNLKTVIDSSSSAGDRVRALAVSFALVTPSGVALADSIARNTFLLKEFGPQLVKSGLSAEQASAQVAKYAESLQLSQLAAENAAKVAVSAAGEFTKAFGPIATAVGVALDQVNTKIVVTEKSVNTFVALLTASSGALSTVYEQQVALNKDSLARFVNDTDVALAKRKISYLEHFKLISDAQLVGQFEQLGNLKIYSDQALQIFDKDAQARRVLAVKNSDDIVKFDIAIRDERIKIQGGFKAKYEQHIVDLGKLETGFTDLVRKNEDEKRDLKEKASNDLRAIARSAFNDEKKLQDELAQAQELRLKGDAAAAAGNFDLAKKYYEQSLSVAIQTAKQGAEEEKKGKKEVADAIIEQSKRSTDEQIKNSVEVAAKIREGNDAAVLGSRARSQGSDAAKVAEEGLIRLLDQSSAAAKAASEKTVALKDDAIAAANEIAKTIQIVAGSQITEIPLRVKASIDQIDIEVALLQKLVAERELIQKVKLSVDAALTDAQNLKDDIEKKKPQLVVEAQFDKLKADAAKAIKELPSIGLDADPAKVLDKLIDVKVAINEVSKTKINVQSNIDVIVARLQEANELNLATKQLTIEVNYTYPNGKPPLSGASGGGGGDAGLRGFSRGGAVSLSASASNLAHFASGGFVGRVPGYGNTDSVFAQLQAGSFVLRKSATEIISDIQSQSRPQFVDPSNIYAREYGGFRAGASSVESSADSASFDAYIARLNERSSFDRSGLIDGLLSGSVDAMRRNIAELRRNTPGGFVEAGAEDLSTRLAQPKINAVKDSYGRAVGQRSDSAANAATQAAIGLATDLRKPLGDINFRSLATRDAGGGNFFAEGGSAKGAGLINAMVTPGEHVFAPAEVRRIGLANLIAFNESASRAKAQQLRFFHDGGYAVPSGPTPAEAFAHNVGPMLRRFNEGGSVSNNSTTNNVTFSPSVTINAASDVDVRQSVRQLLPEFKAALRREGITLR